MYDIMSEPAQIDYIVSEAAALSVSAQAFGAIGDGRMAPSGWEMAVSALINKGECHESLNKMRMFASMPSTTCDIAPRQGDTIVSSISQLEQYAGCPFSYMVKYALRPNDDPGEDITPAGEGAFLHEAMQRLGERLNEYDIYSLEDEDIKDIMEREANIIAQNFDSQRLSRDSKGRYSAKQLTKTAQHGATIYAKHLRNSKFRPIGQEIEFGTGKDLPPIELVLDSGTKVLIKGKVDRLDTCHTPVGKLARIIDYKSSTKKIEYKNIVSGRQLQLFIYMDAYLSVNDDIKASGVFYFPVKNNYIEDGTSRVDEDRMQGLFIDDAENIMALDKDMSELGKSSLIKASYKKDGSFNKNSDNINKEGFYKILNHSKKVATDMLNSIDRGEIPVSPLKTNNESVCKYCDYSAICRKDVNLIEERCELDNDTALEVILGGELDG
jgi:ATP-dependent helicase/nuclease subunit B